MEEVCCQGNDWEEMVRKVFSTIATSLPKDVILVTEDAKRLEAHSLILKTASTTFNSILHKTNNRGGSAASNTSTSHAIFLCSWDLEIWHRVATPKCSIWELLHLRNVRFENCSIWEMLHLRNVRFENCFIWEMLHLRYVQFEKHEDEDKSYILRRLQFQSRRSIRFYLNSEL